VAGTAKDVRAVVPVEVAQPDKAVETAAATVPWKKNLRSIPCVLFLL
jgi:hypothetical protein